MRMFLYYFTHSFVNSIKKLFKSTTGIILACIFGFAIIGGLIGGVVGALTDKKNPDTGSDTQIEQEDNDIFSKLDEETGYKIIEAVTGAVVICVFGFFLYSSEKSCKNIFNMADVNFLFPSPRKPQSNLMFRLILKIGLFIVGSFYLLFQLPSLIANFNLQPLGAVFLFVAWIVTLGMGQLLSLAAYTLTAGNTVKQMVVRVIAIAIMVVPLALMAGVYVTNGKDILPTLLYFPSSSWAKFIPILGWIPAMVYYAMVGNYLFTFLYFLGIIIIGVLLCLIIWNIKVDFYEDALAGASAMQARLEQVQEKGTNAKPQKHNKSNVSGMKKGEGANTFFYKQLLIRKRNMHFGFITNGMFFPLVICVVLSGILRFAAQSNLLVAVSGFLLVYLFFSNYGNPLAVESQLDFLYLVPDKAVKKIGYLLGAGILNTILDILPAYIVSVLLLITAPDTNIGLFLVQAVLWFISFVALDFFASSSGLFIEMLLPSGIAQQLKNVLQVYLKMFAIVPSLLILIILGVMGQLLLAIGIATAVNIGLGILLFSFCPKILENGKN